MPVEIKELVVRMVADKGRQGRENAAEPLCPGGEQQEMVDVCVKQVLRILKRSRER